LFLLIARLPTTDAPRQRDQSGAKISPVGGKSESRTDSDEGCTLIAHLHTTYRLNSYSFWVGPKIRRLLGAFWPPSPKPLLVALLPTQLFSPLAALPRSSSVSGTRQRGEGGIFRDPGRRGELSGSMQLENFPARSESKCCCYSCMGGGGLFGFFLHIHRTVHKKECLASR
jgi:hypothetical protein